MVSLYLSYSSTPRSPTPSTSEIYSEDFSTVKSIPRSLLFVGWNVSRFSYRRVCPLCRSRNRGRNRPLEPDMFPVSLLTTTYITHLVPVRTLAITLIKNFQSVSGTLYRDFWLTRCFVEWGVSKISMFSGISILSGSQKRILFTFSLPGRVRVSITVSILILSPKRS